MTHKKIQEPLSVLIVGCGNIAGGFDMNLSEAQTKGPCTHAGAFSRNDHFKMSACVDIDDSKRQEFQEYWNIKNSFCSLNEVKHSKEHFDVISICSPTKTHQSDILQAIQLKPKVIFCEKPITHDLASTEQLIQYCEENSIELAVNYTRRWDQDVQALKNAIEEQSYGQLRSVIASYNKGIFNNGSHLIDLLSFMLGDLSIDYAMPGIADYSEEDPTITALLSTQDHRPIHLVTAHSEDYTLFEIQFIFQDRIIHMQEGGLYWNDRCIKSSHRFIDYQTIDKGKVRRGQYEQAMLKAIENIYDFIAYGKPLACTGEIALSTQRFCEAILKKSLVPSSGVKS